MSGQKLQEKVASSSELPTEEAVASLRDVILGNYPNDAESVKAKELVIYSTYEPSRNMLIFIFSQKSLHNIMSVYVLWL